MCSVGLAARSKIHERKYKHVTGIQVAASVCVCVCVICTFRGGSLCSVGLDAPFGSGLLMPLWDVGPLPSACVCGGGGDAIL